MQAIILAGGFGTRLKTIVDDTPKPMAPIEGRPFLCWLLEYMQAQGVTEAVLCVHYQHEQIREYFGERFGNIALRYSIEEEPLGTGGAIRKALSILKPKKPLIALNGDSMVKLDYKRMLDLHKQRNKPMTLASYNVGDCSRYSQLTIEEGNLKRFDVLGSAMPGAASVGFYVISPKLFDDYVLPKAFSFERDFLAPYTPHLQPAAYDGIYYFIDIGVPQDYARAQAEVPALT